MNILFVAPNFFDYYKLIKEKLESYHHNVYYFDDRPSTSFISKAILKVYPKLLKQKVKRYFYHKILKSCENIKYDLVFFIEGQSFTNKMITDLKKVLPNTMFIMYHWDSIASWKKRENISSSFDKVFSFDSYDCEKYGYTFLPLFYANEKEIKNNKYDYSSVLTIKPGKLNNFNKIMSLMPDGLNGYNHLYLQSKLVYRYYKFKLKEFKNSKINDFKYYKLSTKEFNDLVGMSKVVIDCQMEGQVGLTIRTFEALHLNKKIITTNKEIKNYEFYTPNNIFVIDDNSKEIPKDFFVTPFDTLYTLSDKYSLDSFLKTILKEMKN